MKVVIGEDGLDPAVQAYLDGLSRSELHELVLTLVECSETRSKSVSPSPRAGSTSSAGTRALEDSSCGIAWAPF